MDWQLPGSEEKTDQNSLNLPRCEIYSCCVCMLVCVCVHVCQGAADMGFLKADSDIYALNGPIADILCIIFEHFYAKNDKISMCHLHFFYFSDRKEPSKIAFRPSCRTKTSPETH